MIWTKGMKTNKGTSFTLQKSQNQGAKWATPAGPKITKKAKVPNFFRIFQEKNVIKGENEILMESNDIIFG